MSLNRLLALCMFAHAAVLAGAGVIEGTAPLTAQPSATIPKARYQGAPTAVAKAPPTTPIVYLEGQFSNRTNAPTAPLQMPQKHFQFTHAVLPVQRGAIVEFPNLDDDYHNVFSYSKPKRFDLGRYRNDEKAPAVTFNEAGVVKLYCEIHEHMRATVLVVDTPIFQRTDTNGTFRLENVPPGAYILKAWLNEKTILSRPVEIKGDETVSVQFDAS